MSAVEGLALGARQRQLVWLCVAGGGLHALALTPWVGQAWPPLAALIQSAGLMCLLGYLRRQPSPRQAAWGGWLYGTAWLIGATGWTFVSLYRYGGLPAWLSALAVLALSGFLALYLAGAAWWWCKHRQGRAGRDALLWAGVWLLAELARALILTGFPWGASGYGLVDVAWGALAPWLGVYGTGAVWAGVCAWLVMAGGDQPMGSMKPVGAVGGVGTVGRWVVASLLLASLLWQPQSGLGLFTRHHGAPLSVTLIQGNVPQDEKFVSELQAPMLVWHAQQLLQAQTDLVIAPETAIPLLPSQLPDGYWEALQAGFNLPGRHALVGVPLGSFEKGYTNSVAGLSAQAAQTQPDGFYRYNKHHLVPFGEFIPWGFHWFVAWMNMPLGDFDRGPLAASSFEVNGQRVAPNICYEDLFGEELAARFQASAQAPTVLANVSNLAWFGDHVAIFQHEQIARMRSKEFQIPTLRATNTGATVIIDHNGQVTQRLPANVQGVLVGQVQGRTGVTPFAWWAGRWGLWPLVALGLLAAIPFNRMPASRR